MSNNKSFLITGGAGFIGSHLARVLLAKGYRVRVLDNLSSGSLDNLTEVADDIEFVEGDIRDADLMLNVAEGTEGIYHLAALVSVPRSVAHPRDSFSSNVAGSFNVFEAARQNGTIPVVFASSAAVYGDNENLPLSEGEVVRPMTPYACDKCYMETLAATYAASYGLSAVGMRLFNAYGERQDPTSPYSGVISLFIDRLSRGEALTVFGDGEQSRDFVYAGDVADAMFMAMTNHTEGFVVYNVGSGASITLNRLIAILAHIHGSEIEVQYQAARVGDIVHSQADISAIKKAISWQPTKSNEAGLKSLMAWMCNGI